VCGVGAGAGSSFPEELDINNFVSGLILSNNLLYNLCFFVCKLVHLEKSFSSKMILLRLKPLVLDQKRILYRVYTRELDRELCAEFVYLIY